MNDFITIKIPLSQNAWQALRDFAQRDRRVPADQASVLLEKLLARRQRTDATKNNNRTPDYQVMGAIAERN